MTNRELAPDAEGTAEFQVKESDLASSLSPAHAVSFPRVFATARMVALMELAAASAMAGILEEGELTVGVAIDVTHTAPTPEGSTVRARARFARREGKLYVFEVSAEDEAGKIGRGLHRRAVIDHKRLLEGASRRRPGPLPKE